MELVEIIERVGVGGGLVIIMFVVIRYFIQAQKELITLVTNHIQHNTEALDKLRGVLEKVCDRLGGKL